MKRFLFALFVSAAAIPSQAADVGVSITVGQPGFYGRIDIGSYPDPQVIYAEPVIVHRAPIAVIRQPIYLHVPPGHAKNWARHCERYRACGQPVYFVQSRWYDDVYAPRYRSAPAVRSGARADYRRDDRRAHDGRDGFRRDDRRDDRSARGPQGKRDDRGRGNDRGKGNSKGNGKGRD